MSSVETMSISDLKKRMCEHYAGKRWEQNMFRALKSQWRDGCAFFVLVGTPDKSIALYNPKTKVLKIAYPYGESKVLTLTDVELDTSSVTATSEDDIYG